MTRKLTALIVLFVIPAAVAADNPHCVTAKNGFGATTTQCDDGTVTVTTGQKVIVCGKALNGSHNCTEIKL
ncbi:TPA: hypothetical protein I8622_002097 [Klebsiella oxytoca]|uniref:hypothetical protein n=1 Tax=Klebsiella oxytoca TaxID=571 RepID=UPI001A1B0554|nr:hypothetical protein [Klebsiella oxytoca]HBM9093085.1 hypothetical protein [Klebsiella oxytoca]